MDISTLEVEDTCPIHVKDAKGNPLYKNDGTPVVITVYGPSSDAYARLETRQTQRAMKRLDENDGKRVAMTPEDRLTQTAEDLAEITHSIDGLTSDGKTGRDLALAIYGNRKLGFIPNQVTAKLNDWGNFAPASPTS
ncbi:hypothetical protein GCM10011380_08870 [Sphingomonas metalli]|uniref:Uncharacterized protein n=1 Tax=Sphingomonas metalli TaxID=1779358 RepID=A0A916SY05_9SPHN|nr:hypothetical protein [Sphingomonas metalli]GGB21521.1 hypothetical protein GCM10011380_08870 [Sphingomonas metalli]